MAKKKKVLLVDVDSQCNTTTCMTIGMGEYEPEHTIMDIFKDDMPEGIDIPYYYFLNEGKRKVNTNISLLPGSPETESDLETDNAFALRDYLDTVKDKYDYCIIDCPPALNVMTMNAACAADYILVPTIPGRDGVNGYGLVYDEIDAMKENGYNVNIKILGTFINIVDSRKSMHNYYASDIWGKRAEVFKSQIRSCSDVPNAYEFGRPVHYFSKSGKAAKDYEKLADEIIKKVKADIKKRR